jgi:hypothetical protein
MDMSSSDLAQQVQRWSECWACHRVPVTPERRRATSAIDLNASKSRNGALQMLGEIHRGEIHQVRRPVGAVDTLM